MAISVHWKHDCSFATMVGYIDDEQCVKLSGELDRRFCGFLELGVKIIWQWLCVKQMRVYRKSLVHPAGSALTPYVAQGCCIVRQRPVAFSALQNVINEQKMQIYYKYPPQQAAENLKLQDCWFFCGLTQTLICGYVIQGVVEEIRI